MIIKQRSGFILACCLAFFLAFPSQATDTEGGVIYVNYHADGAPLPYVDFSVYHLYDMDEDGDFTATWNYTGLGQIQDLTDNEAWLTQGQTAHNFIVVYGLEGDYQGMTDDMGRAMISDLEPGVYLLKFEKTVLDEVAYETEPVLLVVNEDVQTVSPKVDYYPEEDLRLRDIIVLKTWRNDQNLGVRPDDITIKLYENSVLYDTITLNEGNSWSYYWHELDGNSAWGILEEDIPDAYEVEITYDRDSNTTIFHVQNTYNNTDSAIGGGNSVGVGGGGVVAGDVYDTDVEGDLDEKEDTEDTLTETGALLWPIPVLVTSGFLFILMGLWLRKGAK